MAAGTSSGRVHDRTRLLLSSTAQRRCRLQGLQDASLHNGWVLSFDAGVIQVEVNSKRVIHHGEFLYLEVSAAKVLLTFIAYVTSSTGSMISLQVSSDVEERRLTSDSRLRIRPIDGYINSPCGDKKKISVVDVSESGFGFVSEESVELEGLRGILLLSAYGAINLQGEVRHSHHDKELSAYRGGVHVTDMNRVGRARWARLLGG